MRQYGSKWSRSLTYVHPLAASVSIASTISPMCSVAFAMCSGFSSRRLVRIFKECLSVNLGVFFQSLSLFSRHSR